MKYFIPVVKFNNEYYEHGDIVSIITKKDELIVGRLIMSNGISNGDFTCKNYLALDISENFYSKRKFIYYDDIREICKVNRQQ